MIPYVRDISFEYGRVDQVSPLIRRVIADNPGPFTFTGTGTYIVGRGEVAVIDPGPAYDAHLEAILAAIPGETVSHILLTHHHIDHSPLSPALKARTGAPIHANPPAANTGHEEGEDSDAVTDVVLKGGEIIKGGDSKEGGWTLEAIATPGHTSNHICYALKEEDACFTGDHIMGWSTTVITPPDGDMAAYFASLDRIRERGFATLWPTHGPPILQADAFIGAYIAHRRDREAQILGQLAAGPARINAMVPILYAAVDPRLHPAAARSMLAHLLQLVGEGRVIASGEPGVDTEYRLA